MIRATGVLLAALLGAAGGCARLDADAEPEAEAGHDDEHHGDAHHGDEHHEAAGSASTAWIAVVRPSDASLIELPARVEAAPSSRAHLAAPFSGTVVAPVVQVGDTVAEGDPIVELRMPAVLEAAAVLGSAADQIDTHQRRRDRLAALREQGLVGASDVFDLEASLGQLSADRRKALATLNAAGLDARGRRELRRRGTVILRAPTAGVVAELDASPGDVIEPGVSLAWILGRGPARIEVVYSGAIPQQAQLEFIGLDGDRFELAPTPVATAIEPGLGRTLAWYEPADARELAGGVRGRVRLYGERDQLLEVPRRALRLDEGKAYVARRGPDDQPQPVVVQVLRSAGGSALVMGEGLAVGDEVAADANTVLRINRSADELQGGHHH